MVKTVPITGYFAGGEIQVPAVEVYDSTMGVLGWLHSHLVGSAAPLKTQAIRTLDEMAHGKTSINNLAVARWLELKGYVTRVAFEKYHWAWGDWVFQMTDSGHDFHRLNAPPAEW